MDVPEKLRDIKIVLFAPLVAAGVWALYTFSTNTPYEQNIQLSPSNINNLFFFLLVFGVLYSIFVLLYLRHKKHEHLMLIAEVKKSIRGKKKKKRR